MQAEHPNPEVLWGSPRGVITLSCRPVPAEPAPKALALPAFSSSCCSPPLLLHPPELHKAGWRETQTLTGLSTGEESGPRRSTARGISQPQQNFGEALCCSGTEREVLSHATAPCTSTCEHRRAAPSLQHWKGLNLLEVLKSVRKTTRKEILSQEQGKCNTEIIFSLCWESMTLPQRFRGGH